MSISQLIIDVIDAKNALDKAYSECEHDRGYFCYREQERLEEAEKALEDHMSNLLEGKVN